jgi:hypothetical protein
MADEKEIQNAAKIIEYGKLYLKFKEEGKELKDISPVDKRNIFLYFMARQMYIGKNNDPDLTDEEFIRSREERLKMLREQK